MKVTEIRALDNDALVEKLKESRAELFNLRFRMATGQLDDTSKIGEIKKNIARLQTEMRSRELAAQRGAAS